MRGPTFSQVSGRTMQQMTLSNVLTSQVVIRARSLGMDLPDFEEFASSRGTSFAREAYLICSGDRAAAQDAVQEALTKAYVRWGHISGPVQPDRVRAANGHQRVPDDASPMAATTPEPYPDGGGALRRRVRTG